MPLTRLMRAQLIAFVIIALIAAGFFFLGYVRLPAMLGIGRYTVTVNLPRSGGLYPAGNVTYSGTKVGRVSSVSLADDGHVKAVLSLESGIKIPSDLVAEVHSFSPIGEQYLALVPRNGDSRPLRDGDVIAMKDTTVPVAVDTLLDDTNRGLNSIPHDSLKTAIDESYVAFGGLGPELSRLVNGLTKLSSDAHANLGELTGLIDDSPPLLQSQIDSGGAIQQWASHLADVTGSLRDNDAALAGVLDKGASAAEETRQLLERVKPTLPVLLANLSSLDDILIDYQPAVEQLLVLIPQGVAFIGNASVPNQNNPSPWAAGFLNFNLNINLPPPCTTGYLPASQRRNPAQTDAPERPDGYMYCRVPQNAPTDIRGARNLPCLTRPGKRAPTVKLCESDENYVPLNDGNNWKGDPNGTITGQNIPQLDSDLDHPIAPAPPAAPPPVTPAVATAQYDPATGAYIGPDGNRYTLGDINGDEGKDTTWQGMLFPPQ